MRKKKTLDFAQKSKQKKPLALWSVAIVLILLFGICSSLVLLAINDFSIEKLLGARDSNNDETTTFSVVEDVTEAAAPYTDENAVNFLAMCVDGTDITFCELISVSVPENTIRIKPVSPEVKLEYSSQSMSLQEIYSTYSVKAVCEAFGSKTVEVDRWVVISENSFKTLMKNLGEVEMYLENDISYAVDSITYTLTAGTQTMTSETLLNYLKHAGEGDELLTSQAKALATVIKTHFTTEKLQKGEEFFSKLINLVETNISAFDYNIYYDTIYGLIQNSPEISVIS